MAARVKVRRMTVVALAAAGALVVTGACSPGDADSGRPEVTLWYWPGGVDETLLAQVPEQFPDIEFTTLESGDVLTKFRTAAAAGNAPDISIVGGTLADFEDAGGVLADLGPLGADEVREEYVDWKWDAATFADGTIAGFPIDTGPYGLFYRVDLFEELGLPSDPTAVSEQLSTLEGYAEAAQEVYDATDGATTLCARPGNIFNLALGQADVRFVDRAGNYTGDSDAVRAAWDLSAELAQTGACPEPANDVDFNSMLARGDIAAYMGNTWDAASIKQAAPDQSGQWRIAAPPGGGASETGSWLVVSEASENQQAAYDIVEFLLSPESQAQTYVNSALMPSALSAFTDEAANAPDDFFGGQQTLELFGQIVNDSTIQFRAANDEVMKQAFVDGLIAVATQGADPDAQWNQVQERNRTAAGQ